MSNSDPNNRNLPETAMPPSSWAKKTGFKPKFSGETNGSDSGQIISSLPPKPREPEPNLDLEAGQVRQPANGVAHGAKVPVPAPLPPSSAKDQPVKKRRDSDGVPSTNGQATPAPVADQPSQPRITARHEEVVDDEGFASRHSHMKYELRDSPGLGIYQFELFSNFGVLNFSDVFENLMCLMMICVMCGSL